MVIKFPGKDSGVLAIAKIVEGILPPIGTVYAFNLPFNDDQKVIQLNGCIMARVTEIFITESKGKVNHYKVELESLGLRAEEFEELTKIPWFKRTGWAINEGVI